MHNFKIPVLGYHSGDAVGVDYASNDRVAFASDLELIHRLGFSILPLPTLLKWFLEQQYDLLSERKYVVLTMDDGPISDFIDHGAIRSINSILREFLMRRGSVTGEGPLATSFVIASPEARKQSNPVTLSDHWWRDCVNDSLIGIESHSWDHCAPEVYPIAQKDQIKGTFRYIDTYEDADIQFRKAREYIESVTKTDCRYFAFPWGQRNSYLVEEYLPSFQHEHKYLGCLTCDGEYVTRHSSRWEIPRFICRHHWNSSSQLEQILGTSGAAFEPQVSTSTKVSRASNKSTLDAAILNLRDFFTVVEIDESAPFFVNDLVKRRFGAEAPNDPRHFVAFYKAAPSEYWPVGYIKQTPWEDCHLCGAMVVDEILVRKMDPTHRKFIYEQHGGVAEQLLRESFRRVMSSSKAIWGHVGDERALKVDTRVGFRHTDHQYLMVIWNEAIVSAEEKPQLIEKAAAIGVF